MILNLALVLYLLLLMIFFIGNLVIIYHLLTFRLNRTLGVFMVGLLITGSVILIGLNVYCFSLVDWNVLLEAFAI